MIPFHDTQDVETDRRPRQQAHGYDQARLNRVGERLREDIEAGRIHGAALMVSLHGEVILDFVSGYADRAEPLGMHETSLGLRDDLAERLCPVRVAEPDPDALITDQVAQLLCTPGIELPAAAMFTTIADLHRFTEMLRRGGEIGGVRILSPAMLRYSTRNYTGTMRNMVWDSILSSRHWQPTPAALGLGFHVRGEQPLPGQSRFGALNSPRAFGGFGAGSTGCWVDPDYDLGISFLSTGLLEESRHVERTGLLSDMIISALV
jgi:CubicO group peptidase (beta-lactamase class C family)